MLIAEYDYDTDIAVQREEAGKIAFVSRFPPKSSIPAAHCRHKKSPASTAHRAFKFLNAPLIHRPELRGKSCILNYEQSPHCKSAGEKDSTKKKALPLKTKVFNGNA